MDCLPVINISLGKAAVFIFAVENKLLGET